MYNSSTIPMRNRQEPLAKQFTSCLVHHLPVTHTIIIEQKTLGHLYSQIKAHLTCHYLYDLYYIPYICHVIITAVSYRLPIRLYFWCTLFFYKHNCPGVLSFQRSGSLRYRCSQQIIALQASQSQNVL